MRHFLAELFESAAALDAERIVAAASGLAAPHRRPDYRAMEKEVTFALRENLNYAIGHQEIGKVILALLNIFGRHGINVTQDYCLMAKAVLSIEEAAHALDPQFDLRRAAEPVLRELHRERYSPRALAAQMRRGLAGAMTRLGDLPVDLHRLAQRISHDDLTINFQHRGLEELDTAINKASSRLTLAIILGALIVGSSLIIHAGVKPQILGGVSALGVFGYVLSMLLALWIVWDIFRHGRHK
jgi:ubiquinone biosynthesis protein